MTRDEGVAHIQMQLAFRTTLASSIILQLQLAQTMLEAGPTLPWFLLTEEAYTRTTAGDERIPVPDDFIEEVDEIDFKYIPDTISDTNPEVRLVKDEYDVLRKNYFDSSTGITRVGPPEAYALLGEYFRIFPTPDDDYLVKMPYYANATSLVTNVENGWLKHVPYLLLGKAGKQIAGGPLRDTQAYQIFDGWEKEGRAILAAKKVSRELANREMQMGGPH